MVRLKDRVDDARCRGVAVCNHQLHMMVQEVKKSRLLTFDPSIFNDESPLRAIYGNVKIAALYRCVKNGWTYKDSIAIPGLNRYIGHQSAQYVKGLMVKWLCLQIKSCDLCMVVS
jgi:hypothetical protein